MLTCREDILAGRAKYPSKGSDSVEGDFQGKNFDSYQIMPPELD
jgi:hypothetical protein